MANHVIYFVFILQLFVFALGNPPVDTPSRCANARRPDHGSVKCCIDLSSFDDVDTNSGSKSGGKSSGGSSKGPDVYTCTYKCDDGFKLNGPSVLECPIDKITDNPTCEPIECDVLPTIDHGSISCNKSFQYGSVCQYKCAVGYYISGGSKNLTCNKHGMWNGIVPMCQPVLCPALAEPKHGSLLCPSGRIFGSDCRYTCDDRYQLDGPSVATCGANGTWIAAGNKLPTCKLSECIPLPLLVHGSLSCTKGWDRGSLCYYSCHAGYSLTGGNFLLSCRASGFWRGDIPTCEEEWINIVTPPANSTNNSTDCFCGIPPPSPNGIPDFPKRPDEGISPRTTSSPTGLPFTTTPSPEFNTTTEYLTNTTEAISSTMTTNSSGNSTSNSDFDLYDFTDGRGPGGRGGPSSIVGPDSGDESSSGLSGAGIFSIIAVILILMAAVIGLIVAYRYNKQSRQGYGNM